jgi:hypothetical protein
MNHTARPMLLLALAMLPVAACQRPASNTSASETAPPAAASTGARPRTALGRVVDKALQEARDDIETRNISISHGVHINVNGHEINRPDGQQPKAEISPQGDLLIEDRAVAITPAQRALLLDYRQRIVAVAEAGMAMGVKGADLAGKALGETFSGLLNGHSEEAKQRIEAEGRKLEADAKQLCAQLQPMYDTQQKLAASLPEFKPYATMTQSDVDDCMHGHGASVSTK